MLPSSSIWPKTHWNIQHFFLHRVSTMRFMHTEKKLFFVWILWSENFNFLNNYIWCNSRRIYFFATQISKFQLIQKIFTCFQEGAVFMLWHEINCCIWFFFQLTSFWSLSNSKKAKCVFIFCIFDFFNPSVHSSPIEPQKTTTLKLAGARELAHTVMDLFISILNYIW